MKSQQDAVGGQAAALRVLVVDDLAINREVAAALLSYFGAETIEASDGAEAVRWIAEGNAFDLVLMDVQMPVLNGLDATAKIREIERDIARRKHVHLPIVALTSEDITDDERRLQQLGLDAVLQKPLTATTLEACLSRWCPDTFQPH